MKFNFNPQFPDATNSQKWEQIRLWRNVELSSTDWTQLDDAPVDKILWAKYRQDLRDITKSTEIADEVEIPEKP